MWATKLARTPARGLAAARGLSGTSRFKGPKTLCAAQRAVLDEIQRTRTTGVNGPFGPWLANADLAQAAQTLGRIVRYETSLPLRDSELAILATAQHHRSETEWAIHVEEARRAGLEEEVISAIEAGAAELACGTEGDQTLYRFCRELLQESRVSDATYAALVERFSETHAVETVAIVGYYSLVAMTLNVFEIEPPRSH